MAPISIVNSMFSFCHGYNFLLYEIRVMPGPIVLCVYKLLFDLIVGTKENGAKWFIHFLMGEYTRPYTRSMGGTGS